VKDVNWLVPGSKGDAYAHGCSSYVCSPSRRPSPFPVPAALTLRSSTTASTVTSTPLVATSAPAQLTAPRPSPVSMTAPPRRSQRDAVHYALGLRGKGGPHGPDAFIQLLGDGVAEGADGER
jgi:hypothetical protein